MKIRTFLAALIAASILPVVGTAQEGGLPFDFQNRLRVEFDDNVRQTDNNTDSSAVIIEEFQVGKSLTFEQTKLSASYSPSFRYYTDRDEDDSDLHHLFDISILHDVNDRLSLSAANAFRYAEQPELMGTFLGETTVVRNNNDFTYNSANLGADYGLTEVTTLGLEYRNVLLGYEDSAAGDALDYAQNVIGADLMYDLEQNTTVGGEVRLSDWDYEDDGRDASSIQVGAVGERVFSDILSGRVRAGLESKDFDNANSSSSESPYVDGAFLITPSDRSAINFGVNYSMSESSVAGYANQNRASLYAGLDQELSPRIMLGLGANYALGEYDLDEAAEGVDQDGDENVFLLSSRLSYEINELHAVEANFQHSTIDSDVGADYDQNRVSLGWRLSL